MTDLERVKNDVLRYLYEAKNNPRHVAELHEITLDRIAKTLVELFNQRSDLEFEEGEYGNVVNIRYLPTCGHCGAFLDPKGVFLVHKILLDQHPAIVKGVEDHVVPERCPKCGAFFSGIILHTPKEARSNETD